MAYPPPTIASNKASGQSGHPTHHNELAAAVNDIVGHLRQDLFKGTPWHDVKTYGATGDGVTDDTSAIQAAIDAAETSGGTVFLPRGAFRIVGNLTIDQADVVLVGIGRSTVLAFEGGGLHVNAQAATRQGIQIGNLRVTRSGVAGAAVRLSGGGVATGATRWGLHNVRVDSSTGEALRIDGSFLGIVENCYWRGSTIGVNILPDPVLGTVAGNAITFLGGEIQGCGKAVEATSSAGLSFIGTAIEGNTIGAELLSNCRGTTFDGCYFESNGSYDIKVGTNTPNCFGLDISGCVFFDGTGAKIHAIQLLRCNGVNIEGNTFLEYGGEGVLVNEAAAGAVKGSAQNNSNNGGFNEVLLTAGTVFGERTFIRKVTVPVPSSGGTALDVRVAGDTQPRLLLVAASAGGSIQAGSGAAAVDATLRRSADNRWLATGDFEIDGDLDHDGANVGFRGVAPSPLTAAYTPTNVLTDRAYDANATTVDELADVLGTLIADLKAQGLIG